MIRKLRVNGTDHQFRAVGIPFGSVDSTSTSLIYTATVDNFPSTLSDGICAYIKNGVVTSESGFTLNINNTGALPVYQTQADATRVTTAFNINYTFLFVYNSSRVEGGCWDMYYGYTNSLAQTMRTAQVSRTTTAKTYRYRLLFSSADDTQWVPANTSTSTNATAARSANQTPINPWGDIRYYNYTTAVNADSSFSASYLYEQTGITLGYSFNTTGAALALTSKAPVYIKCAPQSNGSAIIDSTTPYTQALPTTADGKIYIYLGVAYSATAVELVPYHPVYYYKDGAIRLWTNANIPVGDFIVPITSAYDSQSDSVVFSTTTTYTELSSAYTTGRRIIASISGEEWSGDVVMTYVWPTDGEDSSYFTAIFTSYSSDVCAPEAISLTEGSNDKIVVTINSPDYELKPFSSSVVANHAIYHGIHPVVATTIVSAQNITPNRYHRFGTITGNITFALATPSDSSIMNHYYWTFVAGSTAPTITWPAGISWFGGSAPTITAGKHYDVSILDNIAVCMEV